MEISERFIDCGHKVTVVTADAREEGKRQERRNGVAIQRYQSIAPNNTMHFSPQITGVVRRSNADIIHAHNYHSYPLFFAALGGRDQKVVMTTHYHGGSASSLRDRLLSLYRPFGRWAVQSAEIVIAVSEWEQKQLMADLGVEARVIPNGVNINRFETATQEQRDQPYLLSVGRLESYKNVSVAIRALQYLTEYHLVVVGTGPARESLEAAAVASGVDDRVEFVGYVPDEQLPRLYAGASAFLTLSEFEAYGLTVGEALATGTPCVVYEQKALAEWTNYDGVVGVDNLTARAAASAVESALETTVSATPLTWSEVTADLIDSYESVISS
jgi:glycosyltransferase involved in cell wall biosynthesis